MRICIFLALATIFCADALAQLSYPKRIEIEMRDGYSDERIIQFGSDGFLLVSKADKKEDGKIGWKLDAYNSDLESNKSAEIKIDDRLWLYRTYTTATQTYLLFIDKRYDFELVRIDFKELEVKQMHGQFPPKSEILNLVVMNNMAFFSGSINHRYFVMRYNQNNGEKNLIPLSVVGYKEKNLSLLEFKVLGNEQEIMLLIKARENRKSSDVFAQFINSEGEKGESYLLTKNIDENLISASATKTAEDEYIFTGTYSLKNLGVSEGIFFGKGTKGKVDFLRFYNYLDLRNFLDYLPSKTQSKIEIKRDRKEKKGKDFSLNYFIEQHEIKPIKGGYLFLGEAYYPTYRTETYYEWTTVNGKSVQQQRTRQVFDGYQYTHAFLAEFSLDGYLKWDNCFKMYPYYKPFVPIKFISIATNSEESIKMAFVESNRIKTKVVDYSGKVLVDHESDAIKTTYEGDKVKGSFSSMNFWYDDYFIAWGLQLIKNTNDKSVDRRRKVFFISKIQVSIPD